MSSVRLSGGLAGRAGCQAAAASVPAVPTYRPTDRPTDRPTGLSGGRDDSVLTGIGGMEVEMLDMKDCRTGSMPSSLCIGMHDYRLPTVGQIHAVLIR